VFRNILIPTDGSPASQKAVRRGVALAKAMKAKITAVIASPPATPIIYRKKMPVGYATPNEHQRMINRSSKRHLDVIARAAKKARLRFEAVQIVSDFPDETILDTAKKKKCDLIVMGTQGQGGLRGVFIGSTTQKVLNQSKIPVMVIR